MARSYDRRANQYRPVKITKDFIKHPEGSVLIEMGDTKVLCAASIEKSVPRFLRNTGKGWVTAEYRMLPRSTNTRMTRESTKGKLGGRTMEIQRLIGRSLRAVTDLELLGERSVYVDCDVIQADGGTRTASITGAFVALYLALQGMVDSGELKKHPVKMFLAAISVGIVDGKPLMDLDYSEDSRADTDMNVVMTEKGGFVEVQSTAEQEPFTKEELDTLLDFGSKGIKKLIKEQKLIIKR